ncbi:MAG: FHA domain-containing protein, partial [Propionibacteriaceae bacterium]|nr:FHA domain-containing protein [Propionibacteriaceae bacterium]
PAPEQQAPSAPSAPPQSGGAPDFESPTGGSQAPEAESDTFEWVLEVWIDPEWFALQDSPDPMPSPGLPEIHPLRKASLLIGRPSRSRNIHPDIDCEPDTGISRRQAQLSTDGTRWFIEDLGSANGTFVADASGGMPTTPVPTGRRRELSADDRIYLGAWTRLVLRKATDEEKGAYAAV